MPRSLQIWQYCMAKVRHHRFRARKPLNLTQVVVAKQKVGVANLKVGGASATPIV